MRSHSQALELILDTGGRFNYWGKFILLTAQVCTAKDYSKAKSMNKEYERITKMYVL